MIELYLTKLGHIWSMFDCLLLLLVVGMANGKVRNIIASVILFHTKVVNNMTKAVNSNAQGDGLIVA